MRPRTLLGAMLAALGGCTAPRPASEPGELLALAKFASIPFGGEGPVRRDGDAVILGAGSPLTGIRYTGDDLPTVDYELTVEATRLRGTDFFCGLTFPVRDSHCTLIIGGWGGALVGLSCLDGADAANNDATTHLPFVDGQPYRLCLRVEATRIVVRIDGMAVIDAAIGQRAVGLRADMADTAPLSLCSYATTARLRDLRLRRW